MYIFKTITYFNKACVIIVHQKTTKIQRDVLNHHGTVVIIVDVTIMVFLRNIFVLICLVQKVRSKVWSYDFCFIETVLQYLTRNNKYSYITRISLFLIYIKSPRKKENFALCLLNPSPLLLTCSVKVIAEKV